jgi:hypothetical protein
VSYSEPSSIIFIIFSEKRTICLDPAFFVPAFAQQCVHFLPKKIEALLQIGVLVVEPCILIIKPGVLVLKLVADCAVLVTLDAQLQRDRHTGRN